MCRQFDSMDICQSVLASFFVPCAAGQFELHRPAQLVALLTKMAQNKLAWHVRYHLQQRRDIRRMQPDAGEAMQRSLSKATGTVEAKELLEQTWKSMDSELREIATVAWTDRAGPKSPKGDRGHCRRAKKAVRSWPG